MHDDTAIWSRKGATLSDKSARKEFGLTQEEIYTAFRAGLQGSCILKCHELVE